MTGAVLVTGGAKRIGRAIVLALADAGHDVAIHCRTSKDAAEALADEVRAMGRRAAVVDAGYPYILAEDAGRVLGYAYAGAYRPRRAYRYTVEDSVYVAEDAHRRGVGQKLLAELIRRCTAEGYRQMIAVIGDSGNAGSISLHRKMGFREVGVTRNIGFKFGRWLDSVTMQLALGDGGDSLPED